MFSLTQLLTKLRVPCSEVIVFAESEVEPSEKRYSFKSLSQQMLINPKLIYSKDKFRKFVSKFISKEGPKNSDQLSVTTSELTKYEEIVRKLNNIY